MKTEQPHAVPDQLELQQLTSYLSSSRTIFDDWDAYSEAHTDLDGQPHDEIAYARRQQARDADTWRAFAPLRPIAKVLIARAERELGKLPPRVIQSRWTWQLGTLHHAADRIETLREEWLATRDSLPSSARPGTAEFDDARAEYLAHAWSYLDDWSTHGQAILDIHAAHHVLRTGAALTRAAAPQPAGRGTAIRR